MALLANGARGMPPRVHRAYRLEMSGRTLLTLLSLLTLTGLVVFYLGVVTGKGLRDPNAPVVASATAPGAPGTAAPATAGTDPTKLTFNQALSSPNPQIEGLKSDQAKLSENTDKLVAQAKQQLELEEVPAKSALIAPPAKPAAKPTAPSVAATAPAKPTVAASKPAPAAAKPATVAARPAVPAKSVAPVATGDSSYTVQVFASTKQANAAELLASLKKKGFPAYLNQYQDENKQTWYRVRVGKGSKADADAMAAKLKASGDIKSPKVLQQ